MPPVMISLSPNAQADDVRLALGLLFKPWSWLKGHDRYRLKQNLARYLDHKNCYLFNAGRSALLVGLQALDLKPGDEVVCQAFTCVAVPNAIIWAGAKPVYCDTVKNGFNVDVSDLAKKVNAKTRAIIVQHTFGQADDMAVIGEICKKHNLILIEDCAHGLGARHNGKKLGTFGDLVMVSFGRDKAISSVSGGALLTSNSDLAAKIDRLYQALDYPRAGWVVQQLLHPLIFSLAVPLYWIGSIGKAMVFIARELKLISLPVDEEEKLGQMTLSPKKMPNAIAAMADKQLKKITGIISHRREIAKIYAHELNQEFRAAGGYLRFPVLVKEPVKLLRRAKMEKIWLGDWYRPVVAPRGVDLKAVGYRAGACPNAEAVSRRVINLPTMVKVSPETAKKISTMVKEYVGA
jgi:dTDP-4-amino-4,6-dideoxygalactose transaminase